MNAYSNEEGNIYGDSPKTPYDGETINAYYNNKGYSYEVALDPPTNELNINDNYDDKKNDHENTPDTHTNGVNNETIDNYEEKQLFKKEKKTDNETLNMKDYDKDTEETEVNKED